MSRLSQIAACAALLCAAATPAIAQQAYPATLAGHAVLPALTVMALSARAAAFIAAEHATGGLHTAPAAR